MKKIISFVLVFCITISFVGCSSNKVKATITTNSGEMKQMTLDEIKEIEDSNSILFNNEYVGANISVTSAVTKIGGAYMLRSWFDCDAYVELEAGSFGTFFKPITEEEAATLNVGDIITVSGRIGMASVASSNIYIFATKTSPY